MYWNVKQETFKTNFPPLSCILGVGVGAGDENKGNFTFNVIGFMFNVKLK